MIKLLFWLIAAMAKGAAPNPQRGAGGGATTVGAKQVDVLACNQIDFRTAGGCSIFMGSGAPGAAVGDGGGNPVAGDIYFRTDTPNTANQRIYICTVGGGAPTWVALTV